MRKTEMSKSLKEFFLKRIEETESSEELNYIVEKASFDLADNKEYEEVYDAALAKAKSWMPI